MASSSSTQEVTDVPIPGPTLLTSDGAEHTKLKSSAETAPSELARSSSLERAGSFLASAASLQRADSLPTNPEDLRHAASLPGHYDQTAERIILGFWTAKQCVGFFLGFLLFFVFLFGDFIKNPDAVKSNSMLGITALMACFWAFEVVPVYMTALIPIVLEPFLEINSTSNVARSYFNEITMLFVGTFLVDIAMEEVELPRRIALNFLIKVGTVRPGVMLATFMGLAWVLSMFTSNIVAALMLCPIAISLMNAAEEEATDEAPDAEDASGGQEAADARIENVQRFSDGLLLSIAYGATIGGLTMLTATPANGVLSGQEAIAGLIDYGKWFLFAAPVSIINIALAFWIIFSRYVRGSAGVLLSPEVIKAEVSDLEAKVGSFSRDEMAVGVVLFAMVVLLIISPWAIEPFVSPGNGIHLINGASISCCAALILFLLPSSVRTGEAILTWRAAHQKLDIGVLILLGGGYALASGFTNSGLQIVLGNAFAGIIRTVHPLALNFIVTFTISGMTQIFGCAATAAAMLPVLISACEHYTAVVNPLQLALPATVACSFSFILPTATPPNVVALALSNGLMRPLRVRDFVSNGLPLTIATSLLGAIITFYMAQVVFDAGAPYPESVCSNSYCKWVYAPGWVQGRAVESQACIILPHDAYMCQLWNGTQMSTQVMPEPEPMAVPVPSP